MHLPTWILRGEGPGAYLHPPAALGSTLASTHMIVRGARSIPASTRRSGEHPCIYPNGLERGPGAHLHPPAALGSILHLPMRNVRRARSIHASTGHSGEHTCITTSRYTQKHFVHFLPSLAPNFAFRAGLATVPVVKNVQIDTVEGRVTLCSMPRCVFSTIIVFGTTCGLGCSSTDCAPAFPNHFWSPTWLVVNCAAGMLLE